VAAGVVAKKILKDATILDETPCSEVNARIIELGGIPCSRQNDEMPEEWKQAIDQAVKEGDSLGAVVECEVPDVDPGYGEPFWDSVEAMIAHAVFSIPGVRGIEFGDGFKAAAMKGSEHNDPIGEDGRPTKNGAGGSNGGITNGAPIIFRVAFKPTSSIRKAQQTFNVGLLNAGYLAACIRDNMKYQRSQLSYTKPVWAPVFPADVSMIGAIGDAVGKINGAYPDYFTEDKLYELTGI
jgi:chorismate synthase